jgi:hydrogenase expression/formation protein HypD
MADAEAKAPENFTILSDFKEIMPVLHTLCAQSQLSGFLLPGHMASITGVQHFAGLPVPGAVAGFEPEKILHAVALLLEAVVSGKKDLLVNDYPEAVRDNGNQAALQLIGRFFDFAPGFWRGLGEIPRSRRTLKAGFAHFDAEKRFDLKDAVCTENPLCRCGEVLTGKISPETCPLFESVCTPETPEGACMASPEGSCAAAFQWKGGAL